MVNDSNRKTTSGKMFKTLEYTSNNTVPMNLNFVFLFFEAGLTMYMSG